VLVLTVRRHPSIHPIPISPHAISLPNSNTNWPTSSTHTVNPHNKTHGAPSDSERHVGDLGNFKTDAQGNATGSVSDKFIKLIGPESVLGRTVVVHAGTDDLGKGDNEESKKTGNAGARPACGVIGISQ
jgi:Cu-Zn family superoxide dismutase